MNSKVKIIAGIAIIAISAAALYFFLMEQDKPKEWKKTIGVPVLSRIALEEFQNKSVIALHTYAGGAETTCNLEISAVSTGDRKGYDIQLERKPLGIFIDRKGAYIQGETDEDLLRACHAFICLREGISCTPDLMDIKNMTLKYNDLVIVIDNRSGPRASQGFAELLGSLGFIQAMLVDENKNGILEQDEVNKSKTHIYPYIKYDDTCILQEFKNAIQTLNITNNTVSCDAFKSGIFLTPGPGDEIIIDGRRVILSGDDESMHTEAIILRDVLSPEFIRFYYGKY